MSLLNEALRKSKSKDQFKVSPDFSPKRSFKPKKSLLIGAVVVLVAAIGLLFSMWIHKTNFSNEPLALPATQEADQKMTLITKEAAGSPLMETSAAENNTLPYKPEKIPITAFEKETAASPAKDSSIGRATDNVPYNNQTSMGKSVAVKKGMSVAASATVSKKETATPLVKDAPKANVIDKVSDKKDASSPNPSASEEGIGAKNKFYQKALRLHRDGRFVEAISMYHEVLKYAPDHPDALYNLSSAYMELSDFSAAYDILNKLLVSNPMAPEILLNLAIAEIGLGRVTDAIDHLNSIHAVDEELQFSRLFHLGVAMSRIGKTEDGLIYYKKAKELKMDYPNLLYNMAILNDRLGRYKEAVDYYSRFLANGSSPADETENVKRRLRILQTYISGTESDKKP
jgi:tetratricopeptide (TPR) repeat protein